MGAGQDLVDEVNAVLYVLQPTILSIGFVSNLLLCAIFFRSAGFYMQALARLVDLLACCTCLGSQLEQRFRLTTNRTATEYLYIQRNYAFVWYAAHLQLPLANVFHTSAVLVALVQCADRIWSLVKPIHYFQMLPIVKRRLITMSVLFSVLLSVLINMYDCWRLEVVESSPGVFTIMSPPSFYTAFINTLVSVRTIVRCVCASLLIVGNCILFILIKRSKRISFAALTKQQEHQMRVLVNLYITQSVLQIISQFTVSINYVLRGATPWLTGTNDFTIYASVVAATSMYASFSLNGFLFACTSRECRTMILKEMKLLRNWMKDKYKSSAAIIPLSLQDFGHP